MATERTERMRAWASFAGSALQATRQEEETGCVTVDPELAVEVADALLAALDERFPAAEGDATPRPA